MFKKYMIIFLLGHILGDFYFQSEKIAKNKDKKYKWILIHGLIYYISIIIVCIPIMNYEFFKMISYISFTHFVIDSLKFKFISTCKKFDSKKIFILDQSLHIFIIFIIAIISTKFNIPITTKNIITDFFVIINIQIYDFYKWLLAILIIEKPANIFIKKTTINYKPKTTDKKQSKKNNHMGKIIGSLERFIILILLSLNQYSAIGFVLTAKSIARYDKIAKDKDFAEYYLLGTLSSTLIVIICSLLILYANVKIKM